MPKARHSVDTCPEVQTGSLSFPINDLLVVLLSDHIAKQSLDIKDRQIILIIFCMHFTKVGCNQDLLFLSVFVFVFPFLFLMLWLGKRQENPNYNS